MTRKEKLRNFLIIFFLFISSSIYSATLDSWITVIPNIINENQRYTVTMSVSNTSGVSAPNTVPGTLSGTIGSMVTSANPAFADIVAGGYQEFTWVFQAGPGSAGPACVTGTATSGSDTSTDITCCSNNCVEAKPNPILSQDFFIIPSQVSVGQQITILMNVTNAGGCDAESVSPNMPLVKVGTGSASIVSGPAPSSMVIAPAANGWFTFVYQATAAGTLGYCGDVAGYSEYSKVTITSMFSCSSPITIQNSASLVCEISADPQKISIGQILTVRMVVTNTGGADAVSVVPGALAQVGTGWFMPISGPVPGPQVILGGSSTVFTWVYSAVTAGTVSFSGGALGNDANSGVFVSSGQCMSNTVIIQTPASLVCGLNAAPSQASVGQYITLVLSVTNVGQADAVNVCPSGPGVMGPGNATMLSAPSCATIPGLTVAHFTWTYSAAASGNVMFTAGAQGTDANAGNAVSTSICSSNNVIIQTPANLSCSINAFQSVVSIGQQITVIMTVTNNGQASAMNTTPSVISMMGTGWAMYISGPSPASSNIPGGSVAYFTWTYSAAGAGNITFNGNASGTDANSGSIISTVGCSSNNVTLLTPANLICSLIAYPDPINVGGMITVIMTVTNIGSATAINTSPSSLSLIGTGSATLISGHMPISVNLPGGTSQNFTWTYSASAGGNLCFSGFVQGVDANSGLAVTSPPALDCINIIPAGANLVISCTSMTSPVSIGQNITVIMLVSNTGSNTANNVAPLLTPMGDTTSLSYILGPAPANAVIAAGGAQQFTWIYNCVGTGSVSFYEEASGTDPVFGTIIAVPITCGPVIMQTAANLSCSINAYPDPVAVGVNITAIMTITNTGQATALIVTPTWGVYGSAAYAIVSIPVPGMNILGGASGSLTWVFTPASVGNFCFSASAHGTDVNSGMAVSSGVCSDCLSVAPNWPVLTSWITASPNVICENQIYTIVTSVSNVGAVDAPNTMLGAPPSGAIGAMISGPSPVVADIPAGGYQEFIHVFQAPAGAIGPSCITELAVSGAQSSTDISCCGNNCIESIVCATLTDTLTATATATPTQQQNTPTPTPTNTVCFGEGSQSVNPSTAYAGSTGNTYTLIYTAGATAWAGSPGHGTLKITIPGGWSQPSITFSDQGYCSVAVNSGSIAGVTIIGQDIFIDVENLAANTGQITVIYGDKSMGGPGATIPPSSCSIPEVVGFGMESSPYGTPLCRLSFTQLIVLSCNSPTVTETPLETITPTITETHTPTLTPTITMTPTPSLTPSVTQTITETATFIPTPTYTNTLLPSPTNTPEAVSPPCFITKWGSYGTGDGQFYKPSGIAADSSGNIYVVDTLNHRIQKFTSTGSYITQWGSLGNGNGQFDRPDGITTDSSGNIYVVDMGNSRIQKFTSTGGYITQWGSPGTGNGQFNHPSRMVADSSGNIYVADSWNNRIQKFTSTGSYITQWGSLGNGNGQFMEPCDIAADSSGNIYVVDMGNSRIQKFTSTGSYITQWGSFGSGAGQLNWPSGIVADSSGNIYVVDMGNNRIQKFTSAGGYITQWGSLGNGNGQFDRARGITVDSGGNIYVTEDNNHRVQKFGDCASPTPTSSATASVSTTYTSTPTNSVSNTQTITETAVLTKTHTPIDTVTHTSTATPSATNFTSPTQTVSWTPVCCGTPTFTSTPTATPPQSTTLLSIKKTVGGEPPAVGALITYEIEIRNTDTKPAYNIMVWDTLPVQVEFLYNNSGVPYVKNGQYFRWDLSAEPAASPLNPGDVIFIDFECRITALNEGVPIANFAGCDYDDASGKHAPIFSQLAFYPLNLPAVYPNPGTDYIKFTNIVPGSQIEIYTLSGEFVNSMDVQKIIEIWDCRNRYNMRVSPGIYYYLIGDAKGKMQYRGKLFIINH